MRDYQSPPPAGTVEVRPYGERLWAGRRYHLRQVWTWRGHRYDLSFEITPAEREGPDAAATILRTSYLAVPVEQIAGLMRTSASSTSDVWMGGSLDRCSSAPDPWLDFAHRRRGE
jgi:hypothetical protein